MKTQNTPTAVPHLFNEKRITQLKEDMVIGDRLIPKHYCNATEMCKANGKRWFNYSQNKGAIAYIEGLSAVAGIPATELVITTQGGTPDLQGTWIHLDVALDLAQWISVPFRIWANRALRAIANNDYAALTPEAEEAKRKVQEIWAELRDEGIEVRKAFTDSIKDHYLGTHPGVNEAPFYAYSNPSDELNRLLTGHPAKYWKQKLGVTTDEQLRNLWGNKQLSRIKNIEDLAQVKVDEENLDPVAAVKEAIAIFHYTVWDEGKLLGKGDKATYYRNYRRESRKLK